MDIVDTKTRSRMMAAVPQKNTKPELLVRSYLHSNGFRYRLHVTELPGTPDIVLTKYQVAVFVHGCFWHRHVNCGKATTPKNNGAWWAQKFSANIARDNRNVSALIAAGWSVIVIWECGIKSKLADLNWLEESIRTPQSQYVEWPHVACSL